MRRSVRLLALSAAALALAAPALAQDEAVPPPEDEAPVAAPDPDEGYDSIVVTGMRVRQGGAQDIRHFRAASAEAGLPRPESLTIEGLMGEHDLDIPASRACAQLFCLNTEAMPASLPTRPDDLLFVGLGFTSNIDAATWRRAPLNLVAVVDKSGSMSGQPIDLVKRSLRQIVGQMRDEDQLTIVLYGSESHVYLQPTRVSGNRSELLAAIDSIAIDGSTNMEAGLKVGYESAFASRNAFRGDTRLMLFTDEQPNVGSTDAESFMGMAEGASRQGIGLTTIGVGVQFDASLATRVSSVRGGNLFFVSNPGEVTSVFERQLDTMVSQLAHDVRIRMTPRPGYRVSGVFGVPDGLMTDAGEGAVSITVPTAFLSTNGGGIFVSLAKDGGRAHLPAASVAPGAPLLDVDLAYVGARDGATKSDRLTVAAPSGRPSAQLQLAHLLTDEYFVLSAATTAFHERNDRREAFRLLSGLSSRIEASRLPGIAGERRLVRDMTQQAAFFAGHSGERPRSLRHLAVVGEWVVSRVEGNAEMRRGDRMSFTEDRELMTMRGDEEDIESYEINERQIHLPQSDVVVDYRTLGDRLELSDTLGGGRIILARVGDGDTD